MIRTLSPRMVSLITRTTALAFPLISAVLAPLTNPQFPAWKVILLFSLLVGAALLGSAHLESIPRAARQGGSKSGVLLVSLLFAVPVLLYLKLFQLSGLVSWRAFVDGYPNARLAADGIGLENGGFHFDTAFHAALIQSILGVGFPSTGLHFSPYLVYHSASHFAQAGLARVFGFNVWDSWALLFEFKAVAVLTALLWLGIRLAGKFGLGAWLAFVAVGIPGLTWNWHVIGNFPYWFPTLLLILSAAWVGKTIKRAAFAPSDLVALTILLILLTFGKIEIGLAWGTLVGGWMAAKSSWAPRVMATGVAWCLLLLGFGLQFNSAPRETGPATFEELANVNLLLVGVLLTVAVALLRLSKSSREPGIPTGVGLLLLGLTAVGLIKRLSLPDIESMIFSSILVMTLIVTGWVLTSAAGTAGQKETSKHSYLRLIASSKLLLLFVASSPLVPPMLSGVVSSRDVVETAGDINRGPFLSVNHYRVLEDQLSIWRQLSAAGARRYYPIDLDDHVARLFQTLSLELETRRLSPGEALLFISAEERSYLASYWKTEELWALGFFVKAISGVSLIYGVDGDPYGGWAISQYGDDASLKSDGQLNALDVCEKSQSVISLSFSREEVDFVCESEFLNGLE